MKIILVAVLLAAVTAQDDQRIRVYLKAPDASGFVDETTKGQRDTFADLSARLAKKKQLKVVESAEQADVVLEILDRDIKDTGGSSTSTVRAPTGLLSSTSKDTTKAVTIQLSAGTYRTTFTGTADQLIGAWKYIAGKLADSVEKWAKENASQVLATRP